MKKFFEEIILPFLRNDIVINWIAPIITGLILLAIPVVLSRIKKNKEVKRINEKIIDAIKPFIIQQIGIDLQTIVNIRTSIIKDSEIDNRKVYGIDDIKNKLILDIAETRYLNEQEKLNLVNFIYKVFVSNVDIKDMLLEEEEEKNKNVRKRIITVELFVIIISCAGIIVIKQNDQSFQENPLFILLVLALVSVAVIEYVYLLLGSNHYIYIVDEIIKNFISSLNIKNNKK